jgi:hypothetical protein
MSIRVRVASTKKTRESQQLTREVVEASLAASKAAQSQKLAALEQAVSK